MKYGLILKVYWRLNRAWKKQKSPADRGKSVNGGRGDGWKDVLRKDVPLRGSGGNFLGFAVQQSAVGAEDIEFVQLMNEKDSRKVVRLFRRQTLPKM